MNPAVMTVGLLASLVTLLLGLAAVLGAGNLKRELAISWVLMTALCAGELWQSWFWWHRAMAWQAAYWRDIDRFQEKQRQLRQNQSQFGLQDFASGVAYLFDPVIRSAQSDNPCALETHKETIQALRPYIASIDLLWCPMDLSFRDQIRLESQNEP